MDVSSLASRWAETWQAGWPAKDVEAIAALYAPGVTYLSFPFREPDRGPEGVRSYLTREFGVESEIECRFGVPVAAGDRAAVQWWACWVEDGEWLTLAGSTFLRFNEDGLITDHRDYWNQSDDRRPPYESWDPAASGDLAAGGGDSGDEV